jgi:hypothetical protein
MMRGDVPAVLCVIHAIPSSGVSPVKARRHRLFQLISCQRLLTLGPWIEAKPVRAAIARCSAVTSLDPISNLGWARIRSQSSSGSRRAAPAAAHGENGAHAFIGEHGVDIGGAIVIRTEK